MHAVELLSGPSSAFLIVNIWSKFVLKTLFVKQHYKIGVSADVFSKNARANLNSYSLVQVGLFLDPQLGPDNNPTLDQTITVQNRHFCFLLLKCAEIPIL